MWRMVGFSCFILSGLMCGQGTVGKKRGGGGGQCSGDDDFIIVGC